MSEPARDLEVIPATSTDGLDDLFDAEVVPGSTGDSMVGPTDGIPVEEAATALGLSVKTVKDRLRKGTLTGFKKRDRFGEKWMVCLGTDYHATEPDYQVVPGPTEPVMPSAEMRALLAVLESKDRELQAASFRNGYLEAQLAERDQQLKLLTDSQHQSKWWHKVRSWFAGQ
jgi:hypothetical protein